VAVALVYQWWTGSPPTAPVTQVDVGGSYATLTAAQRRLVDDWVARYDTATGRSAVPAEVYDGLALSTKTTLNAVTHALSLTLLTDDAGRSMNLTALDLIAKVDAVAGHIPGQGGDRQFRLYVQLRPETQRTRAVTRIQPAGGQHGLSPGVSDLLPRIRRYTVDSVLARARRHARRHRRGLSIECLPDHADQWAPHVIELRRACRQQRRAAQRTLERLGELVAWIHGPSTG